MQWVEQSSSPVMTAAVDAARRVVQAFPQQEKAHRALAETLHRSGDLQGSLAVLEEAAKLFPDSVDLHLKLGRTAIRANQPELALLAARHAFALDPGHIDSQDLLLNTLVANKEFAQAREHLHHVSPSAANALARRQLVLCAEEISWKSLMDTCDEILQQNPADTASRYHRAIALAHLGQKTQAASLLDVDHFLDYRPLPLEDEEDRDAFWAGVKEEILSNPTLTVDPSAYSTRQGKRTLKLQQAGNTFLPRLFRAIRHHVDRYEQTLKDRGHVDDPFCAHRPPKVKLSTWANILSSGGHQVSHIHPSAWLSGVVYVQTPPGGELLVGDPGPRHAGAAQWRISTITPRTGYITLFPSFTPHATVPTHTEEPRIAVAFDIEFLA